MGEESLQFLDVTLRVTAESDEEWLARLVDAYEALHTQTREILATRRALEEERARYRDLFDFAPDGYLVTDFRARILEANWAAADMLATERQSLVGQPLTRFTHPDDRAKLDAHLDRISSGDECTVVWEMRFQPRNRELIYGAVKVTRPVLQELEHARLRWLIRDVTDQVKVRHALARQNEELQGLTRELDAFAHTVAHDLKQPMAVIMGFASLLAEDMGGSLDDQKERMVSGIVRGTRRMADIVESLLLLANTRKDDVAIDLLDMEAIVFRVMANLADEIEALGAQVILPASWPMSAGYAHWVESVWANYVTNALKYGGRPPRVELGGEVERDGVVRFWVRDNGEGLTETEQAKLFAEFSRLGPAQKPGHGLGLTIARRIVNRLGGQVGVDSRVGEGSTFWFTLPSAS